MRGRPVLLAAALLLGPAYLLSPPSSPPLYDGLGFPDEPYRTIGSSTTAPPTSAEGSAPVYRDGSSPPLSAATAEVGPQAAVVLPQGTVAVPAKAGLVRVEVAPVAVPVPPPRLPVLSNAYRVTLTDGGGEPLELLSGRRPALVQLRIPSATDDPVVVQRRTADGWADLPTRRTGVDVYAADLDRSGTVVAVSAASPLLAGRGAGAASRGRSLTAVIGGAAALLVAVVVVRRRRGSAPAGPVA